MINNSILLFKRKSPFDSRCFTPDERVLQFLFCLQDIFLVFDKNKTYRLEYQEVCPALKAAGQSCSNNKHRKSLFIGSSNNKQLLNFDLVGSGFMSVIAHLTSRGSQNTTLTFFSAFYQFTSSNVFIVFVYFITDNLKRILTANITTQPVIKTDTLTHTCINYVSVKCILSSEFALLTNIVPFPASAMFKCGSQS